MPANPWTAAQLAAAIDVLGRHRRVVDALPVISDAVGREVTSDGLQKAFRHKSLPPPTSYLGKALEGAPPTTRTPALPLAAPTDPAPAKQLPDRETFARLFATVRKGMPFAEVCDKLDLSPAKARALIEAARAAGTHIDVAGDVVGYREPLPDEGRVQVITPLPAPGEEQTVAVISDLHAGSKYCMIQQLQDFVRECYQAGARDVLCPGDTLDGCYSHGKYELTHHGLDEQADALFELLPRLDGLRYHAITGNHEETFTKECGADIGMFLQDRFRGRGRTDLRFYGNRGAFLKVRGAFVHLWHPRSGGAYASSYPVQKQIERYVPGQKPHILLCGHWHRFVHLEERDVVALACPTFQGGGSAYGKSLGGAPATGGLLLKWQMAEDGSLASFTLRQRRYPQREPVFDVQVAAE